MRDASRTDERTEPRMRLLASLYPGLYTLIGLVCGLLIGGIALGITVDVLMRNTGLGSLSWVMEANEYALYVVTVLGAPWALRRGAHVRVDLLVRGVPASAARWIEILTDLIGLATSAVLLYYAIVVARQAHLGGARVIKEFIFPEWWIFAAVAVGAILLIIEFGCRIHRMWYADAKEIEARRQ